MKKKILLILIPVIILSSSIFAYKYHRYISLGKELENACFEYSKDRKYEDDPNDRITIADILAPLSDEPYVDELAKYPLKTKEEKEMEEKHIIELIEMGANVNSHDNFYKFTPLAGVVSANDLKLTELLIKRGAQVNAKNINGYTPIFAAESPEMIKLLIKYGADVNAKDNNNRTALEYEILFGNYELAQVYINNGTNLNTYVSNSRTSLHTALTKTGTTDGSEPSEKIDIARYKIAKLLIEKGANINAINDSHETPLNWAVDTSNIRGVKLLVEHKADINIKDNDGKTPYDLTEALYYRDKKAALEIRQILKSAGN
ncbi:MAG: ankyrin repeat domain-containing protein [Spirochaetes bacterium]|nr:ankyrin repeat domain-containing protein [Spirochaetota bacterium]